MLGVQLLEQYNLKVATSLALWRNLWEDREELAHQAKVFMNNYLVPKT